ncbi:MAG: tetratricopeptide repeat protein [Phocaeicola sp.]
MKKLIYTLLIWFSSIGITSAQEVGNDKFNTPVYFESNVRSLFKSEKWEEGKALLDSGLKLYPYLTSLNELAGRYYYYHKQYDIARYHLILSLRDDNSNVLAKQLIINVEEDTGNYSSAICYVNELLEITPYAKGLWRRKIELYRKLNNHVKADALLRRMLLVYPDDSDLVNDLNYRLDLSYREEQKAGHLRESTELLEELIGKVPANEEYYLSLINLYLKQGDPFSALRIASMGEETIPYSEEIIVKKASILAESQNYGRAVDYLKNRNNTVKSARLGALYSNMLLEEAREERDNDPYILYGKIYERTSSQESLDYLINTSVLRGYNEEALYYITIARRGGQYSPSLLFKEFQVNKRIGNIGRATQLLELLQEIQPNNPDIVYELSAIRLKEASDYMLEGNPRDAIRSLNYVVTHSIDPEMRVSAFNKLYSCYIERKDYSNALYILDELASENPSTPLLEKRAYVYCQQGNTDDGLKMLGDSLAITPDSNYKERLVSTYEEIAIPYIKSLIEEGALYDAYDASKNLLTVKPSSLEGLQYAVNVSSALNKTDEFEEHVGSALDKYPTNAFFMVKQSTIYNANSESHRAVELLTPTVNRLRGNQMVVGAFSESSERMAYSLLKENQVDEALDVTNEALKFDKENKSLLYAKGMIYEKMHQYDSAYHYQKVYVPGLIELPSFKCHLNGLLAKGLKNEIGLDYLQARYGDADIITSIAMAYYTRKGKRNIYTGRLFFAGRDGYDSVNKETPTPGGTSLQFQAEWTHIFNKKWEIMMSGAVGGRYFPSTILQGKLQRNFRNDFSLDIHGAFRNISMYQKQFQWNDNLLNEDTNELGFWEFVDWDRKKYNYLNIGIGAFKNSGLFSLSGKLDGYYFGKEYYFSTNLQAKYYFLNDTHSYLQAFATVGTAPESNVIDYAMPSSFEKTSTTVGLGGNILVSPHLALGLTGFWNTFYDKKIKYRSGTQNSYTDIYETTYKNLFNVELHAIIYF